MRATSVGVVALIAASCATQRTDPKQQTRSLVLARIATGMPNAEAELAVAGTTQYFVDLFGVRQEREQLLEQAAVCSAGASLVRDMAEVLFEEARSPESVPDGLRFRRATPLDPDGSSIALSPVVIQRSPAAGFLCVHSRWADACYLVDLDDSEIACTVVLSEF